MKERKKEKKEKNPNKRKKIIFFEGGALHLFFGGWDPRPGADSLKIWLAVKISGMKRLTTNVTVF